MPRTEADIIPETPSCQWKTSIWSYSRAQSLARTICVGVSIAPDGSAHLVLAFTIARSTPLLVVIGLPGLGL
jgi:hypothetical protein